TAWSRAPAVERLPPRVAVRPRVPETALVGKSAGSHPGTGVVLEEPAVRERVDDVGLVGDGQVGIEVRWIPQPERERAAALGGLRARGRRHEGRGGRRGQTHAAPLEQVTTAQIALRGRVGVHGHPPRPIRNLYRPPTSTSPACLWRMIGHFRPEVAPTLWQRAVSCQGACAGDDTVW